VPLSPPITGPAVASETSVNFLKQHHEVMVIQYQRGNLISGKFSLRQLVNILSIGIKLKFLKKSYDSVYLVISSTFWGNMRDMFFLLMMGSKLRRKTVFHLHGANIDRYFNAAPFWIRFLNKRLWSKVKNAIVLGETFKNIFNRYIPNDKIKIVKNFFNPYLLISEERLRTKFILVEKVNVLFLSNLIAEKGYELLLDAFMSLPEDIHSKAELHFAGEFDSFEGKALFLNKIKGRNNILYHGPVEGKEKQELLWNAHIFCLPTIHKYEGQPISILEAYSSGCVVLTTPNGGINDIFINDANGFFLAINMGLDRDRLEEKLREELREKLKMIIMDISNYKDMAYFNRNETMNKYTEEIYCKNVEKIFTDESIENQVMP
jgi:glycosyltransferase involved in cell wall biosynthesis